MSSTVYNQLLNGQSLIMCEQSGVVFIRIGDYYDVDGIFVLTVVVPFVQYAYLILPMEQVKKLIYILSVRN